MKPKRKTRPAPWTTMHPKAPVPKKRKHIKHTSVKRAVELIVYHDVRDKFLAANPYCAVCLDRYNRKEIPMNHVNASTEVHHQLGRGKYLSDVRTFLAVCREHHAYIHDNVTWAMEQGYMKSRLAK